MAGWETSQIPLEKKGANGGSFTTLSSARSFHNTLSQDPKIHRSHWKNSTTNNTYNSPYCSTSQWRSSCNDYNHSPSIHGLQEPVTFSLSVLESSYAYALDRGNGQYTRLVPADRLPTMEDLPKTQGPDGLIILPALCPGARFGAVTDRHFVQGPSVIGEGRPTIKSAQSADTVQNTIDTIVAALPEGEAVVSKVRKAKVYCDKWLHDGTCAFTQQGCRYKHEMPMDRETQIQVGLFKGLPYWYRRQQAMELKSRYTSSSDNSSTFSRVGRTRVNGSVDGRKSAGYSTTLRTGLAQVPGSQRTLPSSGRLFAQHHFATINSGASNGEALFRSVPAVSVFENSYDVLCESDDVEQASI